MKVQPRVLFLEKKGLIIEDWVPDSNEKGDGSVKDDGSLKGWIVNWKGSDRGIILHGKVANVESRPMESLTPQGFSSIAFFPPMDESVNKLRNLDLSTVEGQQTLFVFQQQLEVLQGMEKTVKNQAALQSQMSKSLAGKIMA